MAGREKRAIGLTCPVGGARGLESVGEHEADNSGVDGLGAREGNDSQHGSREDDDRAEELVEGLSQL